MYSMKQPKAKMMGQKQQTNPFKKKTAMKKKKKPMARKRTMPKY